MGASKCKRCGTAVVWVPRAEGGWLPPMERLDANLDEPTADYMHGQQVYLLNDGALAEVRTSALLIWHRCPPDEDVATVPVVGDEIVIEGTGEIVTPEELDAMVDARLKSILRQRHEAEVLLAQRKEAKQEDEREREQARGDRLRSRAMAKHGDALAVDCPYCEVKRGVLCRPMQTGRANAVFNQQPHKDRMDWLYGSGLVREPLVDTPQTVRRLRSLLIPERKIPFNQLHEWLDANYNIWSEIRTTE